ncbi:MAG: hypothetical protein LBU65_05780 [Planctomycetaceae bacterium]|nr:hypothetical protein [Planctomycetaceae bacterium]
MFTITSRSDTEALLHEKFQALLSELDTVGDNASSGHVLYKEQQNFKNNKFTKRPKFYTPIV